MTRVWQAGGHGSAAGLGRQLLWHYPEDAGVQRTAEKVVTALAATGLILSSGEKLFWLAQKVGLKNLDVQVECYHLIAGEIDRGFEQWN